MRCPSCFQEWAGKGACAECGFVESADRLARLLPYRQELRGGRYVIGEVLGKPGGFGVAYRALDTDQGALVVVKECLLTASGHVAREAGQPQVEVNPEFSADYKRRLGDFRREARLISSFDSPYVVRVIDDFAENNTCYYVMPLVEGTDLREYLRQRGGRLPQGEVAQLMRKLLHGLVTIHAKEILHCDIKPSNILITDRKKKPVLIDFGSARSGFELDQSRSLLIAMTMKYAPYEQVSLSPQLGTWTDIYALCATLHECLVGEPPPAAKERFGQDGGEHDTYVSIRRRMPDIAPGLAAVIDGGLTLLPRQRLPNAQIALALLGDDAGPPLTTPVAETIPAGPSPVPLPNVKGVVALAPQFHRSALLGLIPAVSLLACGVVADPGFLMGWPLLVIAANLTAWGAWLTQRRAQAEVAPTTNNSQSQAIEPPPSEVVAVELLLTSEGTELRHVVPPHRVVLIGRSVKADLTIANPLLSAKHVRIIVNEQGEFTLEDLASTNHTFVQDARKGGAPGVWKQVEEASGRKGRFSLGPPDGGGVLLEIRQTTIQP
jgi:serine/threonine protein kinase